MYKFQSIVAAAAFLCLVASCAPPVGGVGRMADGKPLASELAFSGDLKSMTVTIVSPEGWICTTTRDDKTAPVSKAAKIIQVPISCSDGVSGSSLWSYSDNPLVITISFALPKGRNGSVRHQIGR